MSDTAIRVEALSKRYNIGLAKQRHDTLRDQIAEGFRSIFRSNGHGSAPSDQLAASSGTLWALKDVSFEVKKGEVLGIIGRNGAGKSTLLKILSRLTVPTKGAADIYGRVGSLLEVGTGFHGELTGRENVYLNGAILGMKRAEIDRKFDEIAAFAEVENFLDTPVKRYSSGMHVRLAFSVAAHLEPDILIIDEVLAVGDVSFQNRCLGKMEDVAGQGRTVLFVSHNLAAVANLCRSAICLDQGQIMARGDVATTINDYLKSCTMDQSPKNHVRRQGTGDARLTGVRLLDSDGNSRDTFSMGEPVVVEFDTECFRSVPSLFMSVDIKQASTGLAVLHLTTSDAGFNPEPMSVGKHRFQMTMPNCLLYPGAYKFSLYVGSQEEPYDYVQDALAFTVIQSGYSKRSSPFYSHLGVFHSPSTWREI